MVKTKNLKKIALGAAAVTMSAAMVIPVAFNGFTFASAEDKKPVASVNGYNSYIASGDMLTATKKTNLKIAEESAVLLKNNIKGDKAALPLSESERNITMFHSISNSIVGYFGRNENYMLSALHAFTGFAPANENPTTVYESLENNNFNYNKNMKRLYDKYDYYTDNDKSQYGINTRRGPNLDVISLAENSFSHYNDAAVITISRVGCEGYDGLRLQDPTEGLHVFDAKQGERYLALNDGEKELIEYVKGKFEKVVVLINAPMPLEIAELQDDDGVAAIMWIGYPGWNGFEAVGELLSGVVNPSGRLVDTWAADVSKDPTWYNFYNNSQTSDDGKPNYYVLDKDGNKTSYVSIDYSEGIYMGYKWYETAAADGYYEATAPETLPANYLPAGVTDDYYNRYNGVVYPFGYGLSYSEFTQEFVSTAVTPDKDGNVELEVKVTNNSTTAGKEVVQLYYNPTYVDGGVEKAATNLLAFAKTDVIKGGASATVKLSFNIRDMASYDVDGKVEKGYKGYVLEGGAYGISLKNNSHEEIDSLTYTHAETTKYDKDSNTGKTIEQLFSGDNYYNTDRTQYTTDGSGLKVMTRAEQTVDGKKVKGLVATFPKTAGNVKFKDEALELLEMQEINYSSSKDSATDKYLGSMYKSEEEIKALGWTQENDPEANRVNGWNTPIMLADMKGIDYMGTEALNPETLTATAKTAFKNSDNTYMNGKQAWTKFMNQLTWDEMATLASDANFSTPAIDSIGKPKTVDNDGPAQIGTQTNPCMNFACGTNIASTWNVDLVEEYGELIGSHAINQGITGWYGPGLNIHRNPYGGRNYEYYSEDAILTGKMASAAIRGAASKGVVTYMKHFALNNQEENRHGVLTWADEQTMREIYLKGFEIAVEEGGATGVMCSFNAIGGIGACMNNHLTVKLLTEEWGFRGAIITDAYGDSGWPSGLIVRSQTAPLGKYSSVVEGKWDAEKNLPVVKGEGSATQYYAVRMTAQRMLYSVANSNGMKTTTPISTKLEVWKFDEENCGKEVTFKQGDGGYVWLGIGAREKGDYTRMWVSGDSVTDCSRGSEWYTIFPGFDWHMGGDSLYDTPVAGEYNLKMWVTKDYLKSEVIDVKFTVTSAFKDKTFSGTEGIDFNGQIELVEDSAISSINSCTATGLPAGLTVNADGSITGKATENGTFNVQFVINGAYQWNSTITLSAKTTHTVTFAGNYDGCVNTTVEVAPNGTVTAPATNPEREGFEFVGWFEDADCTVAADFSKAVTGAKTYYAKWTEVEVPGPGFKVVDGVLKYTPDGENWIDVANMSDLKGETPTVEINADGYWVINGEVTNVKAQGPAGEQGAPGEKGSGCSGSFAQSGIAVSVAIVTLTAAMAAISIIRKKKDNK